MAKFVREKYNQTKYYQNESAFRIIKRELFQDRLALVCFIFMVMLVTFIIIFSLVTDSSEILSSNFNVFRLQPASRQHILGTDGSGRDNFAILVIATRNSLILIAIIATVSGVIGIIYGLIAGYLGGIYDNLMMRVVEGISTLPILVLIIALLPLIPGTPIVSFATLMILLTWTGVAKVVRVKLVQEKELEYIQASKTLGTAHFKIIFSQLLPNLSTDIIAGVTLNTATVAAVEAALSILGFGFTRATPTLGTLISPFDNLVIFLRHYSIMWMPPTIVLVLIIFSINTIGNMLTRVADARQRR